METFVMRQFLDPCLLVYPPPTKQETELREHEKRLMYEKFSRTIAEYIEAHPEYATNIKSEMYKLIEISCVIMTREQARELRLKADAYDRYVSNPNNCTSYYVTSYPTGK